ncbi:cobamide remodeling phosphodiesterase CbiR [Desulfobaculum senezii]
MSYRSLAERIQGAAWTLAAPSSVIPAGVAENCCHLEGTFPEVALLFFESQSCLEYTPQDLPPWLAGLDLSYHVHLPLDLPWGEGADAAWAIVQELVEKAAYLSPRAYVLHPPADAATMGRFAELWRGAGYDPADLLLENIDTCNLRAHLPYVAQWGVSLCLDLGHMLAYEQEFLADEVDYGAVRMLHLNAPGENGRHLPLTALDDNGRALLQKQLDALRPDAVITVELFTERDVMDSAHVLLTMLGEDQR